MKRSEAFPSRYVSKDEVETPVTWTITGVGKVEMDDDNGEKKSPPVMTFSDAGSKPLILNNTNWMVLEDLYGEDSDKWIGKTIELYKEPNVMFGNKRVGGVRVRKPQNGNGHAPEVSRQAMVDELMQVRVKIKELKPELLPQKPTPDQLAGEGLAAQLSAHNLILEAVKLEVAA